MKNLTISGLITALITPFKNNRIDYLSLQNLLEMQINSKVDAVVLFGTTGEGASLSLAEKKSIFLLTKAVVKNKMPIITCISSPVTSDAINLAKHFEGWGANANMLISPYYYKCTEEGIIEHFDKVINATSIPIIPYNVPSRTNCNLMDMPNVLKYFNSNSKIAAIKQADSSLKNCIDLKNKTAIPLLCGNDEFLLECLQSGYIGAISVISNIFPSEMKQIIALTTQKKIEKAASIFNKLAVLIQALNDLPNPISVKYAASILLNCEASLRLPLCEPNEELKKKIHKAILYYKEN
ncbi:MAG: 4-hydroxy-tetrahydrodipicolinate synthase [Clostridiales bacterium]|nr:4-hydroxy-tetrahydrodipicolinate synthase [Clostridiales bacterium]